MIRPFSLVPFATLALIVGLLTSTSATAQSTHDYAHSKAGKAVLQQLASEGVDADRARALLADAVYQPDIVAAMKSPAESRLTWKKYRRIFLGQKRIHNGAAFIREHQDIFDKVTQTYGVPAHVIAAIIGVETRYGRVVGRHRVLDALATLAFDYPRRSKFFTRELTHFLQLCVEETLDCSREVGSYAGAMGWPQFMPSSYRHYAVDFNNDGRRDLWNEPGDIIASVANYLKENGWQRGQRVALPATISKSDKLSSIRTSRVHPHYTWAELKSLGVHVAHPPQPSTSVGLIKLEGAHGTEYWLGLPNFFAITTYNRSPLYAMAVHQLGDEIAASADTQTVAKR